MDRERAEAYLRLLAEAELRRWSAWAPGTAVSHRLALVTHALCAVGAIDAGTGEQIQAELDFALVMQQAGSASASSPGPEAPSPVVAVQAGLDRLAQAQAARAVSVSGPSARHPASRQASWRFTPVGSVIQIPDTDLLLLTYAQTPGGTRFTTAARARRSPRLRGPRPRPYRFTAADDRGATYHLSSRTGSRAGLIELHPDPPPDVRWLDLTTSPGGPAIRIEIGPRDSTAPAPAIAVTQKATSPGDLLLDVIAARLLTVTVAFPPDTAEQRAATRRELLWHAAENRLGDIVNALQAADALPAHSPVPGRLAGLCARLGVSGHGITAPPADDLPEPWESMLTRGHRREPRPSRPPGRWAALGAELPGLDGTRIALLDLHHDETGTIMHMLVSGVTREDDWPYGRVVRPLPTLWIHDSGGRWHTTEAYSTGGTGGEVVLRLEVRPPLDRGTAWIDVVAAGQSAEARATLPLHWRQSGLP